MLDRIRSLFAEDHTLPVEDVTQHYIEERGDALARARERAETLCQEVLDAMKGLEEALEVLQGYEDAEGLAVVEDVAENVSRDRLRMIDVFEPADDPEELHEAVDTFIDDFQTMTQKESAVLDRIGDPARAVFDGLKSVKKANERLGSHIDDGYEAVRTRDRLQDLVDQYTSLEDDITALDTELDELDTAAIRDEITELEEEQAALDDDPRMERKRALQEQLQELQEERDAIRSRVKRAGRKMERGLKKLVYEARNGDVTLSRGTITVLEDIVDGRIADEFTDPAADIEQAVETALDVLPQDMVSDRQRERFEEGAETLTRLDELRTEMQEVADRIADAQEELDGIAIDEEQEQLDIRLEQARSRLQNRSERRTELRQKRERKEAELADIRAAIEDVLNEALPGDHAVTADAQV